MTRLTKVGVVTAVAALGFAPRAAGQAPAAARAPRPPEPAAVMGQTPAPAALGAPVGRPVDSLGSAAVRWFPQDPGDSLYRAARAALERGDYRSSASLYRRVHTRYPRSAYAGDALYWEAFSRYRLGGPADLRSALRALESQRRQYPNAATRKDGEALATRIEGELARTGDAEAAARVAVEAEAAAPPPPPVQAPAAPRPARAPRPPRPPKVAQVDEEDDIRIAALNALLQMDAERAVPILKRVMERRDSGSVALRRKAVFLLSQHSSTETTSILLDAVRNDPDPEVRSQAVFWLSQVQDEGAVTALAEILRTATDPELQNKAIFALSQQQSPRAGQILRDFAARESGVSDELRGQAVFWLSQHGGPENAGFLRELYGRVRSPEVKEKILFSLSQTGDQANGRFLMDVALDASQPIELRKHALFWAGQSGTVAITDLVRLYDTATDREMKEQLIFVYSQRSETPAVDKLMDIARREADRELRRKALFWLGQSRDPRVVKFLEEIISQ